MSSFFFFFFQFKTFRSLNYQTSEALDIDPESADQWRIFPNNTSSDEMLVIHQSIVIDFNRAVRRSYLFLVAFLKHKHENLLKDEDYFKKVWLLILKEIFLMFSPELELSYF